MEATSFNFVIRYLTHGVPIRQSPISIYLSGSRRSVPALHLFKGAQTETVRLHFDASASSELLK